GGAPKKRMSWPPLLLGFPPGLFFELLLQAAAPEMSAIRATPPIARTSPCLKASNPPHVENQPQRRGPASPGAPLSAGSLTRSCVEGRYPTRNPPLSALFAGLPYPFPTWHWIFSWVFPPTGPLASPP